MELYEENAQFNMAISCLIRMNYLLITANQAMLKEDYYLAYKAIFGLHRELVVWMNKEEVVKATNCKNKANQSVIYSLNPKMKTNVHDVIKDLFDYESLLREVMHRNKLDFPKGQDPRLAIMGG